MITVIPTAGLLRQLSQHPVLPVLVASPAFSVQPPSGLESRMEEPKRLSAYLIFFMVEGLTSHDVDLCRVSLSDGRVLCVQPHQIHRNIGGWPSAHSWYKMAFDGETLRRLPRHFDFLDDPLGVGTFPGGPRLAAGFEALIRVLSGEAAAVDVVLAYINVLLTEMNDAYFRLGAVGPVDPDLQVYLGFKRLVEERFASQPPVHGLASTLSVSDNRLYAVVRRLSGVSPKAFIMRRTILEAQRMFYYDRPSVKEVAYALGFSDPDHFSRVFKRVTGSTATGFIQALR